MRLAITAALLCCVLESALGLETSRGFHVVSRKDHQLPGCRLKTVATSSQISCAHICASLSSCISTNYQLSTGLCELNECRAGSTEMHDNDLQRHGGFVYNEYRQKDCQLSGCRHGGLCSFGEGLVFHCSCGLRWAGDSCDVRRDLTFNFTTLGAEGREGPENAAGYKGTTLENVKIDDGIQKWRAPITGGYQVEACGATGGNGTQGAIGGKGAKVSGEIRILAGTLLKVLVGQQGQSFGNTEAGSGGGGTFIIYGNNTPLAIAGGGGGGYTLPGDPGQAGGNGSANGGSAGSGGGVCQEGLLPPPNGGSGGGLTGDGCWFVKAPCSCKPHEGAGTAFFKGGEGGEGERSSNQDGGFGGGGAFEVSPGGGGGYSGGGATYEKGGGGGSFKLNGSWLIETGVCHGNGFATIRYIDGGA